MTSRIYPEEPLVEYEPETPLRDNSKDRKSKQQLSNEIYSAALTRFRHLFKARYKVKAPAIRRVPKFRREFETQFNALMSQVYREAQLDWASIPEFSAQEVHSEMLLARTVIATEFVDWIFAPGHRFGEICQGDLISGHWWTEYAKSLLKEQDRQKGFTEAVAEVESTEKSRWRESSW